MKRQKHSVPMTPSAFVELCAEAHPRAEGGDNHDHHGGPVHGLAPEQIAKTTEGELTDEGSDESDGLEGVVDVGGHVARGII